MQPLLQRLAALTNGHDDVRLETEGRIAGRWFAAMDSDAGHELIAAGLLILAGPFDGDRLAGGLRRGLHEPLSRYQLALAGDATRRLIMCRAWGCERQWIRRSGC